MLQDIWWMVWLPVYVYWLVVRLPIGFEGPFFHVESRFEEVSNDFVWWLYGYFQPSIYFQKYGVFCWDSWAAPWCSWVDQLEKVTAMSAYFWKKKDEGVGIASTTWELLKQFHIYKPGGKSCDLCLSEKLLIMMNKDPRNLNVRSELTDNTPTALKRRLNSVSPYQFMWIIP